MTPAIQTARAEVQHVLRNPLDHTRPLVPLMHQWEFATSKAYQTFLAGGWGSAKSAGLAMFLAISAFYNPPRTTGIVMLPTQKLMHEFLDSILKPVFGDLITGENKGDGIVFMHGNRRLVYLSGHVPERIEHYTACYAGIDEPGLQSSRVLFKLAGRLRDSRATWRRIGLTGVPVWGWLKDEFDGKDDSFRRIIHCSTHDNTHLAEDAIEDMRRSCPARLRNCYISGQFVPPGGTVHPGFGDRNLIEWQYNKYFETIVIIDPSLRTPGILFAQFLPTGTTIKEHGKLTRDSAVIFDELILGDPEEGITTPRACAHIKAKSYKLSRGIMDPAAKAREATSGLDSMRQAGQHLGIPIVLPPEYLRGVEAGIEHVNLALEPLVGHPTLFVAKHLERERNPRGVVNSFRAFSYPQTKEGKAIENKPHKDGITDHAMDCARYLVVTVLPSVPRLIGPRVRKNL